MLLCVQIAKANCIVVATAATVILSLPARNVAHGIPSSTVCLMNAMELPCKNLLSVKPAMKNITMLPTEDFFHKPVHAMIVASSLVFMKVIHQF